MLARKQLYCVGAPTIGKVPRLNDIRWCRSLKMLRYSLREGYETLVTSKVGRFIKYMKCMSGKLSFEGQDGPNPKDILSSIKRLFERQKGKEG